MDCSLPTCGLCQLEHYSCVFHDFERDLGNELLESPLRRMLKEGAVPSRRVRRHQDLTEVSAQMSETRTVPRAKRERPRKLLHLFHKKFCNHMCGQERASGSRPSTTTYESRRNRIVLETVKTPMISQENSCFAMSYEVALRKSKVVNIPNAYLHVFLVLSILHILRTYCKKKHRVCPPLPGPCI